MAELIQTGKVRHLCAELGIGFVAYSPLGRGFLTRAGSAAGVGRLGSMALTVVGDAAQARVMWIYKQYLDLVASGEKTVEIRVGYPRMRRIAPGQLIRFVSGDEKYLTLVTEYPSFEVQRTA